MSTKNKIAELEQRFAAVPAIEQMNLMYRELRDLLFKYKDQFHKMETGPDKDDFGKALEKLREVTNLLEKWF